MDSHARERPTLVLRNRNFAPPPDAPQGPRADREKISQPPRPPQSPQPPQSTRKPPQPERRRRRDGGLEHKTPNAQLVFIKNVPQYLAEHSVPEILEQYEPVFIKRIHPQGYTTTVVCGLVSNALAQRVQKEINGRRVADSILQVELYSDDKSLQVVKGNPKALEKSRKHAQWLDEVGDIEEEEEYEEDLAEPPLRLSDSDNFPALPGREKPKKSGQDTPAKAWTPQRSPVQRAASPLTAGPQPILRKTPPKLPVATPFVTDPSQDEDNLSGPTAVEATPARTPTSTPALSHKGKHKGKWTPFTDWENHPANGNHNEPSLVIPATQRLMSALDVHDVQTPVQEPVQDPPQEPPSQPLIASVHDQLSAAHKPVLQPLRKEITWDNISAAAAQRKSILPPRTENMSTTQRLRHAHQKDCAFCKRRNWMS